MNAPHISLSVAKLSKAWERHLSEINKLQRRDYVRAPALARQSARFADLKQISDSAKRFQAFLKIPSFEGDVLEVWSSWSPAEQLSHAQAARARKPRRKLPDGRTVESIVRAICNKPENKRRLAKQLWVEFCQRLTEDDANAKIVSTTDDPSKEAIEYRAGAKVRCISRRRFENVVSSIRRP